MSRRAGFDVQALWSDDGIVLSIADGEELPDLDLLLPDAEELEELVLEQLGRSALFASQFRENAARALLLPRRRPGARTPLWAQRLRSQKLLAIARNHPSFPMLIETYRSCMQDVFDLPALIELLRAVERRELRVDEVETTSASPFARSLVFAYVAAYLYEGDSPLAERKAQALALDRGLLRELLGQEELRELLDPGVIDELEAELQHLSPEWRAAHPDALHDVLRHVGELSEAEIAERSEGDSRRWLAELESARRVARVRVGGRACFIASEDASLYRDALGVSLPAGLPQAFLESRERPLESLLIRFARTHGPFETGAIASRFRLPAEAVVRCLAALEARGSLVRGAFRANGNDEEWCDADVLRRIKRLTLARLRREVAPTERVALARFLPAWHGVGEAAIGPGRLQEAIAQLEGLPLSFAELEERILPARVRGFHARMLDELGATGWLVWIGRGSLGRDDGRIALYRRDRIARLSELPEVPEGLDEAAQRILDHLARRGASFFTEIEAACRPASEQEVLDALWELVHAGLVTNDTFIALRSLRIRRKSSRPRRGSSQAVTTAGRWSLVSDLLTNAPSTTERAHARTVGLLERYGIVSREAAALEELPGGFGAVYPVLRAMEEAGKVRRGYFVEGLAGAQFAFPGAVDRLRALRAPPNRAEAMLLSAADPANAYGWLLPWPATLGTGPGPRRIAGASVVLVNGEPVLFLDRGGRRVRTFEGEVDREHVLLAANALAQSARKRRGRLLRIEQINGEPARESSFAPLFREARFSADHRGLVPETG